MSKIISETGKDYVGGVVRCVTSWGLSILSLEGLSLGRLVARGHPFKSMGLDKIFIEIHKLLLKFIEKLKRLRRAKTISIKEQSWRLSFPNFETCCKATVKTFGYQQKDRHTDQWNRTESSETNLNIQLTFDKSAEAIYWIKDILSNKWHWRN